MYLLQSEPYSARGHFCQCCKACDVHIVAKVLASCLHVAVGAVQSLGPLLPGVLRVQCCKACVSTLLQKCMCLHVAVGAVQCPGPLLPVLQTVCVHIFAKVFVSTCCSRSRTVPGATSANVAKLVCPHCCKSVCAYMLQSEPYSARGHFCQVVCDYGMVLIWAIHESKVL
jgi:hypothetical protein